LWNLCVFHAEKFDRHTKARTRFAMSARQGGARIDAVARAAEQTNKLARDRADSMAARGFALWPGFAGALDSTRGKTHRGVEASR
jgi:hypothetical protein